MASNSPSYGPFPVVSRVRDLQDVFHASNRLRPFITLSYASSLDGSLSAQRGAPTAISCAETLALTHALRAAHCGILVGVGTVLIDDPSLTVRLAAGLSPTPIVIDACLALPPKARLLVLACRGRGRDAVILHGPRCAADVDCAACGTCGEWTDRAAALRAAGARLVEVPRLRLQGVSSSTQNHHHHHIDFAAALPILSAEPFCIKSVMVEGGARLIASIVSQNEDAGGEALIDAVLVTLAPMLLTGGVHASGSGGGGGVGRLSLSFESIEKIGKDIVVLALPTRGG